MPEAVIASGIRGTETVLAAANEALKKICDGKGIETGVSFPGTTYYLPLACGLLNREVATVAGCLEVLEDARRLSRGELAANGFFIPALDGVLNKGVAALLAEEVLAVLETAGGRHPHPGCTGFIPDTVLRALGLQLVDGRIAGIAVILGPAADDDAAVSLIRGFQSRGIVSLLAGSRREETLKDQLVRRGIALGLENYIVPLGDDYLSAVYAVNFAARAPLTFGGQKPGQWEGILEYMRNRVPAFVLVLGYMDDVLVSTGLGALAFGFPVVTDVEVPSIGKIDTTLYEALVSEKDYDKLVSRCILARGIKVRRADVDIPVAYAAAFEGERVRRDQVHAEFGGKASLAFEYLVSCRDADALEDGAVELIGEDIDTVTSQSPRLPLAVFVEVYGRKMQKDFEPILERQIHRFINYALGLMHVGQRDMLWMRISGDAFGKGFRLKHLGRIIHAMLHQEYSAIVDKVQVTLITEEKRVVSLVEEARCAYSERDERISGMSDENVDTYYSCLLCQSFAPNHVCIITPERLGLCGAYSWLDAKAAYEITPTGANQPVKKDAVLDGRLGQWKTVNSFVHSASNKTVERVSMYSLMDAPQTSCGCFESIIAVIPEANGVMAVHRDYAGMTPIGMTFTTLAASVGGGVQTPGFLGVGKRYLLSRKFILAEGGLKRLVWMPKELKDQLHDRLRERARQIGEPELIEKIADETVAETAEELLAYLERVGHPALAMDALF